MRHLTGWVLDVALNSSTHTHTFTLPHSPPHMYIVHTYTLSPPPPLHRPHWCYSSAGGWSLLNGGSCWNLPQWCLGHCLWRPLGPTRCPSCLRPAWIFWTCKTAMVNARSGGQHWSMMLTFFLGLLHFYLPFTFTIIHGIGRCSSALLCIIVSRNLSLKQGRPAGNEATMMPCVTAVVCLILCTVVGLWILLCWWHSWLFIIFTVFFGCGAGGGEMKCTALYWNRPFCSKDQRPNGCLKNLVNI